MSAGTPASVSSLVHLTSEMVRRLCGWDAREEELKKKIFWHSAELQATTKQQAGYPEVWGFFFSVFTFFSPQSGTNNRLGINSDHVKMNAVTIRVSWSKSLHRCAMWVSKGFRVPLGPSGSSGRAACYMFCLIKKENCQCVSDKRLRGISPYTRRSHTHPESHLCKVCRPQQQEHALCRSCILLLGSWGNKASPHLDTNTHRKHLIQCNKVDLCVCYRAQRWTNILQLQES